jgi:uridine kinase
MLRSERIAQKINEKIKVWLKDHTRLIVAIDGYAGSGKTTVANFIAKQNPYALIVHLDDFICHWEDRKKMIKSTKDKPEVFERSWYRYDDLEKLIRAFKTRNKDSIKFKTYNYNKNDFGPFKFFDLSKRILVIDGIFLFHPIHKINKEWDKTVYLDVDLVKADKKIIAREKKKWGKNYLPESHPDNWVKYYKKAYRRYIKNCKPQKNRDLVFKL